MAKVNIDALIPREDFEVIEGVDSGLKKHTISAEDIKSDSFFFQNLRKPDFQRETNEWEPEKVSELVRSFVAGELIPAVILWRSQAGYLFVIDGSHRLSAIAAWVNDDYGDGASSQAFYEGSLPAEQREIAEQTRNLVNRDVGSYFDHRKSLVTKDNLQKKIIDQARNLGSLAIQLQWVEGDISKAESSFFKINQQAAPIDKTELKLLKDRRKPTSISARAIIRSGYGHKYWSSFSGTKQTQIRKLATDVFGALFTPLLKNPIKTLDLPMAGKINAAQTLPLIVDMISIAMRVDSSDPSLNEDDTTGTATIEVLKRIRKLVFVMNANDPSSLGLHPAIYFYSQDGRFKSSSFLAMVRFIDELSAQKKLNNFIKGRKRFESFILEYDYLAQQINRKHRTADRSFPYIVGFFQKVLDGINLDLSDAKIITSIKKEDDFNYLATVRPKVITGKQGGKFDSDTKSEVFIRSALSTAPKCAICGGLVHSNSISIDHKKRRREGGSAHALNGQLTHPYCNTGYKA